MAGIEQVLNYVKNITETLNQWAANAKKTEELPAMETMDPDGLLMVSQLDNGVWKSKKLEIQKIIDGISLSGQNNKVREVLLGTITATQNLNYLLDNNGITVTEDEIIVLTALTTINATLVQKQYLWKLGKGEYNPIGSANIATKMLELQPRLLNEIVSDELTSSPSAVVYDLGVISNTVLENINNANPAYNFTDDEKIYYIRYIKNDVKILYNFIGINNNYGLGQSQMTQADLVLVYSSANSDPTELLNTKLDKGGYQGNAQDLSDSIESKKNKVLAITTEPSVTKTLAATDEHIRFTNANPVTFTIPNNASVPILVGTSVKYTQEGDGVVTLSGAGIDFVTNLSLVMVKGETRTLTNIDTDTWTVESSSYSAIYKAGQLCVFKNPANTNGSILEAGDMVTGIVEGMFINASYSGGDTTLLTSFDIINKTEI